MINWHIVFPNIKEDILTKKRTVLHFPDIGAILVGDHILIHSDNTTDNIYADAVIKSITTVKLKDISKASILKMNINYHQNYYERLYKTYPEYYLTFDSDLFEIEFEYCPDLTEDANKYFMEIYKAILTRSTALLQSTQQTEDNNLPNNLTDTKY